MPARRRSPSLLHRLAAIGAGLSLLLAAVGPAGAAAAATPPTIEQLQAALLMTVARFVEWPASAFASPSALLVVAVVSDEAVADALEATAAGRNINGRPVDTKRLQWDSDMSGVHLLFVGQSEPRRVEALMKHVRGKPILTVSMLPRFSHAGGRITLTDNGGRLSFSVNSPATGDTGLRLSSSLLSHATRVTHEAGPGVP